MRHHLQFLRVVFVAVAIFSFAAVASAQEITGSIVGTVKDVNGAVVKGATVTITDTEKKQIVRTISTDDDGAFTASDLHVGIYDVTVEAPNFKRHLESKVQ